MTSRSAPIADDFDGLHALAQGQRLWHRFRINCTSPTALGGLINEAQAAGATLRNLSLDGYDDDQHEVRLRLCGIGSAAARALSERFHGLETVRSSQVEHLWTREV